MKKPLLLLFFSILLLISCNPVTYSVTSIPSLTLSRTQTPEITTPATSTPRIVTPDVITAAINFVPELSGSLFVGYSDSGVYVELDFDTDRAFRYHFPRGCQLLSTRLKAVCKVDYIQDDDGFYIYDVLTEQRDFTEEKDGRRNLTSSEHLLAYTHAGPEGIGISISAYDFRDNTSFNIGTFDTKERKLAIPQLSNSAQSMIGLNYEGLSWDYDDEWYIMNAGTMEAQPITVPVNIAATDDSVEWSPNDAMVALVGFYRDDEDPHVGTLRCKKEVLIYDPIAQMVESRIKVPEKRCYTPIDLYRDSIWSPDSSKLALVLDQQDICIIRVSENRPVCFLISNYYKTNNYVTSLTWSPDSNYVAFIVDRNEVQVYSIEDNKTYIIVDTDNLSSLPIGSDLVWGQK